MKRELMLATAITVVLPITGCGGVMSDIKEGAAALKDGAQAAKDGIQAVKDGAAALKDGAQVVKDGFQAVKKGVQSATNLPDQVPGSLNPCSGGSK